MTQKEFVMGTKARKLIRRVLGHRTRANKIADRVRNDLILLARKVITVWVNR